VRSFTEDIAEAEMKARLLVAFALVSPLAFAGRRPLLSQARRCSVSWALLARQTKCSWWKLFPPDCDPPSPATRRSQRSFAMRWCGEEEARLEPRLYPCPI